MVLKDGHFAKGDQNYLFFYYLFSLYTTHASPVGIPRDIYSLLFFFFF